VNEDKDVVIVAARNAYPLYLKHAMYFCQPGRTFREVDRIAFYTGNEIKPEIPSILARRDHVSIDRATARSLQASASRADAAIGELVERLICDGVLGEGDVQQMFLLSPANDVRTVRLRGPIHNASVGRRGQRIAWTQGQRYASLAELEANPETTQALDRNG
jgi:hypothetical protein